MSAQRNSEHNYGTGRRKTSVARVFLRKGKGKITINKRLVDDYFGRETLCMIVRQPLVVTENLGKFDITATVVGGGPSGQAGAVRLGIARALLELSREQLGIAGEAVEGTTVVNPVHTKLRAAGLLTRDSRKVERKKVGRHKARKGTQYSKR